MSDEEKGDVAISRAVLRRDYLPPAEGPDGIIFVRRHAIDGITSSIVVNGSTLAEVEAFLAEDDEDES